MSIFFAFIIAFLLLLMITDAFFIVRQQTAVVIERLGKFHSVRFAGFHTKIPFIDRKSRPINLRIQQLDVIVETKTKDDVFVHLKVSTQYQIPKDRVKDAYYKLEDPAAQITSYIFDVVRAEVPKMRLDDVFVRKDDIAIAIKRELNDAMIDYGYNIIKTLVTDIDPAAQVKAAMNRINAAEREKVAAQYEGDAQRIRMVARAQAEAESKRLQGKGIADQRREIAKGLEESVDVLNRAGINPQEASALIVITQHYDTLQAIGQDTKSNLILLPNAPNTASSLLNEMVASLVAANKASEIIRDSKDKDNNENKK
jgi:regulator of protease activity HflC (stomatin/prohibitin superfamily)